MVQDRQGKVMAENWKKILDIIPTNSTLSKTDLKNIVDTIQKTLKEEWTAGYWVGYNKAYEIGGKK